MLKYIQESYNKQSNNALLVITLPFLLSYNGLFTARGIYLSVGTFSLGRLRNAGQYSGLKIHINASVLGNVQWKCFSTKTENKQKVQLVLTFPVCWLNFFSVSKTAEWKVIISCDVLQLFPSQLPTLIWTSDWLYS